MCCKFAAPAARARCAVKGSLSGFRYLGTGRCSGKGPEPGAGSVPGFGSPAQPRVAAAPPRGPPPPPPRLRGPGRATRAAGALAAAAVTAVALAVAAWRRARPVREVLFFPSRPCCIEALLAEAAEPGTPARPCTCPLPSGDTALSRLVSRLLSARRSLDLCLFSFSCPQLARAVQLLHRRGVRVRLVTDAQYMGLHGSQIGRLRHAGIQVRHDQHSGYMHHKFAIVDRRMLITGSLNWTAQAIQSNRENVLVVEDVEYVKAFQEEFERIWEEYNPANYSFFSERQ